MDAKAAGKIILFIAFGGGAAMLCDEIAVLAAVKEQQLFAVSSRWYPCAPALEMQLDLQSLLRFDKMSCLRSFPFTFQSIN